MSKELIYKLLWSTIEDYVGLWELLWETNSISSSSTSDIELAKRVLLYFIEAGLVNLYYDKWGNDQLVEIGLQESIEIININKYWSPPDINDFCVKVGSTQKGEKYYNEELIEDI
ncbi:MAG: hypothetical protein JNK77_01420 [Saprospiraceae bacterium]|nr:hypothetical protein [Saprospiraceae bacterium]